MARILSSLLACLTIGGCRPSVDQDIRPIKELIGSYKDAPLGKSIRAMSRRLADCDILLPTDGVHQKAGPLRLKISTDNRGLDWIYAYTDEEELLAAFPAGSPFVGMKFADAFEIAASNARFGGICINTTEEHQYLIPRDVFDVVREELDKLQHISNPAQ